MYKILENNNWVVGTPTDGEEYRFYPNSKSQAYIQSIWVDGNLINKIVITSHTNRALVEVGSSLTVTAEIRDTDDNLLPITDSFAMPVGRVGGANYRTIMMSFVDGVCSKTTTWNDAGEFEVTESMINMHLDENSKLDFSGFKISVAE